MWPTERAAGSTLPLGRLLPLLARALPGLEGRVGLPAPDEFAIGSASAAIGQLLLHLRQQHPEAGPHYWGCRSWSLLLWQPAYATVLAVELAAVLPDFSAMQQRLLPGMVAGFSLPEQMLQPAAIASLRQQAARQLTEMADCLHAQLHAQQPLHPKLAGRLLADCVAAALLRVQQQRPALANATVTDWCGQWLDAMQLPQASGLWPVALEQGGERLALERRACCQHFRRCDGTLCSTCPKLKPAARIALLRQEWAQQDVELA